ncbi:hypothetical protein B0J17DRAFT_631433 [Rhizoctonia solani]|nr:hypothetical protein B0J17DRAFT_631433 [Rhizoctonia solani]
MPQFYSDNDSRSPDGLQGVNEIRSDIGNSLPASKILELLGQHGCKNVTNQLDMSKIGKRAVCNGGFGDVYRGALKNKDWIAIKCLRIPGAHDGNEDSKQLKASGLQQSNCNGVSVDGKWRPRFLSNSLPHVNRYDLCWQIADAVAYLGDCDMVHGDIKGVVSKDHVPKLADFGTSGLSKYTLAFSITTAAPHMTLRWTYDQAPEIFHGETKHTYESDVYALGMEVFTGSVPYEDLLDLAVMGRLLKRIPPERPQQLGDKSWDTLWALIIKCWKNKPQERLAALQVRDELKVIMKAQADEKEAAQRLNDTVTLLAPTLSLIDSRTADNPRKSELPVPLFYRPRLPRMLVNQSRDTKNRGPSTGNPWPALSPPSQWNMIRYQLEPRVNSKRIQNFRTNVIPLLQDTTVPLVDKQKKLGKFIAFTAQNLTPVPLGHAFCHYCLEAIDRGTNRDSASCPICLARFDLESATAISGAERLEQETKLWAALRKPQAQAPLHLSPDEKSQPALEASKNVRTVVDITRWLLQAEATSLESEIMRQTQIIFWESLSGRVAHLEAQLKLTPTAKYSQIHNSSHNHVPRTTSPITQSSAYGRNDTNSLAEAMFSDMPHLPPGKHSSYPPTATQLHSWEEVICDYRANNANGLSVDVGERLKLLPGATLSAQGWIWGHFVLSQGGDHVHSKQASYRSFYGRQSSNYDTNYPDKRRSGTKGHRGQVGSVQAESMPGLQESGLLLLQPLFFMNIDHRTCFSHVFLRVLYALLESIANVSLKTIPRLAFTSTHGSVNLVCGTDNPPQSVLPNSDEARLSASSVLAVPATRLIKVYWYLSSSQVNATIAALNSQLVGSEFAFQRSALKYTKNIQWFDSFKNEDNIAFTTIMKNKLHIGIAKELNIYSVGFTTSDLEGFATFSWWYINAPKLDGVVFK